MSDQMEIKIRLLSEEEIRDRHLMGSDVWASFSVGGKEIALTDDYGTATVLSAYDPYENGVTIKEAVETIADASGVLWELALKRDPVADAHRAATNAIENANNVTIEAATAKVRELYSDAGAYGIALETGDGPDEACFYVEWIDLDDTQQRLTVTGDLVDYWEPVQDIIGNLWTEGPLSGTTSMEISMRDIDPSEMNPTETSCRPAGWIDPDAQ